jgi:hypothetical protein
MALSCDTHPHFTTIADFISTLDKEIVKLFIEVLLVCDQMNLIGKEMFAIDGVKLPSNAFKDWSGTKEELTHKKEKIEGKTGLAVYFADPYAAWQRGTNENTNGLLRYYFPKGTDFRKVSEKELALVVRKLNNRPRECLNYQTPSEVYRQALRGAL